MRVEECYRRNILMTDYYLLYAIALPACQNFNIHYYALLYLFADEECQEMDENAKRNKNVRERGVSCFNEALPILQYICSKLDEAQK